MSEKESTAGNLAICAIFKNEGPYILEWLAYHIAIGVDSFFVADNESSDGSSILLMDLAELGVIKYLDFPTPINEAPQLAAYRKLMELYGSGADWVAFIDADEFLAPLNGKAIKSVLSEISCLAPSVGGLAVNWANYGASGEKEYRPELVMERFVARAEQSFGVNYHYKSIVRVEAYKTTHENPHLFSLKPGYSYFYPDGRELTDSVKGIKGISDEVCWENLRLNHYIIKSYGEFLLKKSRGRATVKGNAGLERNIEFFNAHDTNQEQDSPSEALVLQVKNIITGLKSKLRLKGTPMEIIEITPQSAVKINAVIDSCQGLGDNSLIVGWAFCSDHEKVEFSVVVGNVQIAIDRLEEVERPDVVQHLPGAPLRCGFRISVNADALIEGRGETPFLQISTSKMVAKLPLQLAQRS